MNHPAPESFVIGNGSEARDVMQLLSDWLFELGFGDESLDYGHRLYTKCRLMFGEGQFRINGNNLERFGSSWGIAVTGDEIERFLTEGL